MSRNRNRDRERPITVSINELQRHALAVLNLGPAQLFDDLFDLLNEITAPTGCASHVVTIGQMCTGIEFDFFRLALAFRI